MPRSQRVMPLKVNLAYHALDALCVVIDLGHVFPQDPAGYVLRGGRAAAAQQLHEHQGLVDVAHAHALGDGVAQALVGGGGSWRHGGLRGGGTCGGEALRRCHALLHPLGYTWRSAYSYFTE